MKYCTAILLIACCSALSCIAQDNNEVLLHIPKTGKLVSDFIPKGYRIFFTTSGDFNKNGREDKVVVAEEKGMASGNKRLLLILFKTTTGWKLAGRSRSFLGASDKNHDPMIKMNVKGSTLVIHQISYVQGILSNVSNTLKYQNGDFFLVRKIVDSSSIQFKCEHLNEYRSKVHEDINYVTGVRVQKKINYYCELLIDKRDTIEVKPLLKLSEVNTE